MVNIVVIVRLGRLTADWLTEGVRRPSKAGSVIRLSPVEQTPPPPSSLLPLSTSRQFQSQQAWPYLYGRHDMRSSSEAATPRSLTWCRVTDRTLSLSHTPTPTSYLPSPSHHTSLPRPIKWDLYFTERRRENLSPPPPLVSWPAGPGLVGLTSFLLCLWEAILIWGQGESSLWL